MEFIIYNKRQGFTLIEILVVIAIIGILVAIVTMSMSEPRAKSRDVDRVTDLKNLELALALYKEANLNNTYPASLNDLAPNFIAVVPTDPKGNTYNYSTGASDTTYVLYTDDLESSANPSSCYVKSREATAPSTPADIVACSDL
ncbi:prepilin-type N-terminal cleavage/methylation domain-containing protein [Candidatus Kaiserbacteria bacterium]|nr:prepilin-type N-terminal cleavage/methylation domain-containing protein [Candidatus Kaiserbacteria bacterium]